ncbi:PQQ-binding-like beta-propeller repeat protein [Natrinema salaciae]|uniref:Outer membrane protein assembly factor BamB, contains PQQ-like beta-propeller repeat n=1 Tax=Natrinema salaciae TaxID=1186196 RepID=A0A1H9RHK9_9EURY|nr:PQQ-binding-like beta-propeller repeat protein [Natrinema salaciae]SER72300.1 Outer membrane protein assembly factor BamB, contains PQQ-like beta-propeller repeat [Natrinema salaciae]
MPDWNRRSVLATGAALSTTGILAAVGSTVAEEDASTEGVATGDPPGWSSVHGNAANSRYLPLDDGFPEPNTIAWRSDTLYGVSNDGDIAVVDGRIYIVGEFESTDYEQTELRVASTDDGTLEWKTEVTGRQRPTVADGTVYVSGVDRVTAFDTEDGSLQWVREFDSEQWISNATAADGEIYVVTGGTRFNADATLYALDGEDGSIQWKRKQVEARQENRETADPAPVGFKSAPVAVANGSVYAITGGGEFKGSGSKPGLQWNGGVTALDAKTGEKQWGVVLEDGAFIKIIATDAFVCVQNMPDGLEETVLDSETGETVLTSNSTRAATADVRVTHDTFRPSSGPITVSTYGTDDSWTASDIYYFPPLIAGDTLIATRTSESSIVGFDLESGTEKWNWEFDGTPHALAGVDENTLYFKLYKADRPTELIALRASDDRGEGREGDDRDETEPDDDTEDGSDESDSDC